MRKWMAAAALSTVALSACVTINVYFPAAEVKAAAEEFVDGVIGNEGASSTTEKPKGQTASLQRFRQLLSNIEFDPSSLLISSAHAQNVDVTIKTPAIQKIQAGMTERFRTHLEKHFNSGALGLTKDGLIAVRDAAKVALPDRVAVNQHVADDNRDRKAVYREIAVANGHPEWEGQIRDIFSKQWVDSARAGWWYQDGNGAWKQK
jgi:uncharacterized protein YdbL (DUF1318 family)